MGGSVLPELPAERTPALLSDSQLPHLTLSLNLQGQLQIFTHLISMIKKKRLSDKLACD